MIDVSKPRSRSLLEAWLVPVVVAVFAFAVFAALIASFLSDRSVKAAAHALRDL